MGRLLTMNNDELKHFIVHDTKEIELYVINTRRKIHMFPETSFEEIETAKFVEDELNKIGYDTKRVVKTGIIATLPDLIEGKTTALRADIDALNVNEENDISYRSQNPGKMHACGHDAHTAMLLGAAKLLFKYKNQLNGNLKLIFQPGEEGGAGAKKIIDEGAFDDIDFVFGIHIWGELPSGIIGLRKGPIFASSDRFRIIITGKGGHGASPHQTIDPISISAEIYDALQKIITREINPFEPRLLALPKFEGSNASNIISSKTILQGTLRTLNPVTRKYTINRVKEITEGYSKAWRCDGKVEFDPMAYPSVINDDEVVDNIREILRPIGKNDKMKQTMVGEDFAFYLQKAKGAFITLGTFNKEKGIIYPHHHPKFQVDESILWKGTAIYSFLGFYPSFIYESSR